MRCDRGLSMRPDSTLTRPHIEEFLDFGLPSDVAREQLLFRTRRDPRAIVHGPFSCEIRRQGHNVDDRALRDRVTYDVLAAYI